MTCPVCNGTGKDPRGGGCFNCGGTGTVASAAKRQESAVAEDLLDARVRHSRCGSDRSVALTISDSSADRIAPCLLGCGTPRGCAAHADQRIHLVRDVAATEEELGVRLRLGVAGVASLTDERLNPLVFHRVSNRDLCLCEANGADLCSGHMARIVATGAFVKGES